MDHAGNITLSVLGPTREFWTDESGWADCEGKNLRHCYATLIGTFNVLFTGIVRPENWEM